MLILKKISYNFFNQRGKRLMVQDLNSQQPLVSDIKTTWYLVLKKLNKEYGNEIYNSWLKNLNVKSLESETLVFSVPSKFVRDWITAHYVDKIIFYIGEENPEIKRVKIIVDSMLIESQESSNNEIFVEKKGEESFFNYWRGYFFHG